MSDNPCPVIRKAKQHALRQIHEAFAHKSSSKANKNCVVTNLGDFNLKKCSVALKRIRLPVATEESDKIVQNPESSAKDLSERAKRLLRRQNVLQTNTVNEKKRDVATSKAAKPNKLNWSTSIESGDIDESTIRKMSNCSVELKQLSPAKLELLENEEIQKSSAGDRQQPGTSKRLLRQNAATQGKEEETVPEVVMVMPKPIVIKTEWNSEPEVSDNVDDSLDDGGQSVAPKKGGRTKKQTKKLIRWNFERMVLSENDEPERANRKEQTAAKRRKAEPKPQKSSKKATKKNVNETAAEDENNNSASSSSAASKSANVTKRVPMKNLTNQPGRDAPEEKLTRSIFDPTESVVYSPDHESTRLSTINETLNESAGRPNSTYLVF